MHMRVHAHAYTHICTVFIDVTAYIDRIQYIHNNALYMHQCIRTHTKQIMS